MPDNDLKSGEYSRPTLTPMAWRTRIRMALSVLRGTHWAKPRWPDPKWWKPGDPIMLDGSDPVASAVAECARCDWEPLTALAASVLMDVHEAENGLASTPYRDQSYWACEARRQLRQATDRLQVLVQSMERQRV